jgi:hypothetical protein
MSAEPAAWLAVADDGSESSAVYSLREQAEAAAREWGWMIAPLFTQPTLTDAEREAVEYAAAFIHAKGLHRQSKSMVDDAATLRGLLERLA